MKKRRKLKKRKKLDKKKLVIDFLYNLLLGGKEYDTEIKKAAPLPLKTIFATVTLTALTLALIFSFIQISEISSDIGDLKKEIVGLTSKEGKLQDDLHHKYPIASLTEEIEALGFAKENGQIVIVGGTEETEEIP